MKEMFPRSCLLSVEASYRGFTSDNSVVGGFIGHPHRVRSAPFYKDARFRFEIHLQPDALLSQSERYVVFANTMVHRSCVRLGTSLSRTPRHIVYEN